MQRSLHLVSLSLVTLFATASSTTLLADEPVKLLGTIVKWRYPDGEIGRSVGSDAATIDVDGKRTVPSIMLKTTMVTPDSIEKVVAFYRGLLERKDNRIGVAPEMGQSVVFNDESDGRPFAFHTILINSANTSTTIIITRAEGEDHTHITWKQYVKHEVGG